jgi:putative ABC transport system permease protein
MTWASGGIALGLLGAWAISRAIASLLFDVSAVDPVTFAVAGSVLSVVAVLACALPAIHATQTDPITALRSD